MAGFYGDAEEANETPPAPYDRPDFDAVWEPDASDDPPCDPVTGLPLAPCACCGAETVSRASFCIYLVHLFFLDFVTGHGVSAGAYPPLWMVPCLTLGCFAFGFAVWLVLRRVPLVNNYLI